MGSFVVVVLCIIACYWLLRHVVQLCVPVSCICHNVVVQRVYLAFNLHSFILAKNPKPLLAHFNQVTVHHPTYNAWSLYEQNHRRMNTTQKIDRQCFVVCNLTQNSGATISCTNIAITYCESCLPFLWGSGFVFYKMWFVFYKMWFIANPNFLTFSSLS